ncbi:hypothetical protein STPH2_0622 [Streptomyces sp. KO7888]|uniref:DUF4231 domain-containing protein n=1 Tax=Streptomyces TaxID=1883 RepID=UPI0013F5C1F5|nr:DUF4231 domain-containing protein [Streptomyces sp. KO7888]NHI05259.1 hypothetical protein [Streptomyces sp. KO7888]
MQPARVSPLVSDAWSQQASWSKAADRQKRSIGRARAAGLLCGVLTAVLATAAAQVGSTHRDVAQWLAFGAAVTAGVVPLLNGPAVQRQIQDWTRLRSVSEAFKAEMYAFLAGVGRYRTPDAAAAQLHRAVDDIRQNASDLLHHLMDAPVVSFRPLPDVHDIDSYLQVRIRGQIDGYYRVRAARMRTRLLALRRAQLALGVFAVLLGAASGAFHAEKAAAWVAVVSTVSAALIAYSAAAKYEYQELEFLRTADELERILADWQLSADRTEQAEDSLIGRCEQVISILNDTWMVKWGSES